MGRKEPSRPINPFFWSSRAGRHFHRKGSSQAKDLAENHRAKRRLRTQFERAKRTLSSPTQEEIDSLFHDTDFLFSRS